MKCTSLIPALMLVAGLVQAAEFIILESAPAEAASDSAREHSRRAADHVQPELAPAHEPRLWADESEAQANARKARESREGRVESEAEASWILQTDEARQIPVLVMPAKMQNQEYMRRKAGAYAAPAPAPAQKKPACRDVSNTVGDIGGDASQSGVSAHQKGVSAVGSRNCE